MLLHTVREVTYILWVYKMIAYLEHVYFSAGSVSDTSVAALWCATL